jgi:hypothetical protein
MPFKVFSLFVSEQARNPLGPTSHSIGEIKVEPDHYKADVELLDKYQAFSAELLRLSLAGMVVIGFLIEKIVAGGRFSTDDTAALIGFKICSFGSVILLCVSAAASLLHRYFATDGVYYPVKAVRLRLLSHSMKAMDSDIQTRLDEAIKNRKAIYKLSGTFLLAAGVFLWAGIVLLAVAFACVLFSLKAGT